MPGICRGKRVRVVLRSGHTFEAPADGRFACNWSLDLGKWSIEKWELT
jgi:hypothetical protein